MFDRSEQSHPRHDGETLPIRIIPELRAAHVERFFESDPVHILYFTAKPDLEGTDIPDGFVTVSLLEAIVTVATSSAPILETAEPMWIKYLPHTLLIAVAWRISGWFRCTARRARAYAIENNDAVSVVFGRSALAGAIAGPTVWCLGVAIRMLFEKIAYGSPAAQECYSKIPFVAGIESLTTLELPVARATAGRVSRRSAVFIGRLETRKGVNDLLRSWERVEVVDGSADLSIIGDGQLSSEVAEWAAADPHHRHYLGQLSHAEIAPVLAGSQVLIAPSKRDGRWREQIGLPISEGLQHGLTVVTTSETGLAAWLQEHGHRVIPVEQLSEGLAAAVIDALEHPLEKVLVWASLPLTQGRIISDRWLRR